MSEPVSKRGPLVFLLNGTDFYPSRQRPRDFIRIATHLTCDGGPFNTTNTGYRQLAKMRIDSATAWCRTQRYFRVACTCPSRSRALIIFSSTPVIGRAPRQTEVALGSR